MALAFSTSMQMLQSIYLGKMREVVARLASCDSLDAQYRADGNVFLLEASVLQARKALEATAFAAIAPNRDEYAKFRQEADRPVDYRKDFNARAILQYLSKINSDFYPMPLLPPSKVADGHWHFERRGDGFLTKNEFETFYDRLGKYLHADNPWGPSKEIQNLAGDLPVTMKRLRTLLEWHGTVIRTPAFNGVWVVHVPADGSDPHIITAGTTGEFVVQQ